MVSSLSLGTTPPPAWCSCSTQEEGTDTGQKLHELAEPASLLVVSLGSLSQQLLLPPHWPELGPMVTPLQRRLGNVVFKLNTLGLFSEE